jgi:hypothetical protein
MDGLSVRPSEQSILVTSRFRPVTHQSLIRSYLFDFAAVFWAFRICWFQQFLHLNKYNKCIRSYSAIETAHRLAETQHASSVPSAKLDLADLHLTVGCMGVAMHGFQWMLMASYGNLQCWMWLSANFLCFSPLYLCTTNTDILKNTDIATMTDYDSRGPYIPPKVTCECIETSHSCLTSKLGFPWFSRPGKALPPKPRQAAPARNI